MVQDAVTLASPVGTQHLVLFHHSPVRTDDALDEIPERFCGTTQEGMLITVAPQGQQLDVC